LAAAAEFYATAENKLKKEIGLPPNINPTA